MGEREDGRCTGQQRRPHDALGPETAEMRLSSRVVVRARRNCADGYIDARKAHAVVTMPRPCLAILMVQCMRVRRVGGTTEGKTADLEKNADVP